MTFVTKIECIAPLTACGLIYLAEGVAFWTLVHDSSGCDIGLMPNAVVGARRSLWLTKAISARQVALSGAILRAVHREHLEMFCDCSCVICKAEHEATRLYGSCGAESMPGLPADEKGR